MSPKQNIGDLSPASPAFPSDPSWWRGTGCPSLRNSPLLSAIGVEFRPFDLSSAPHDKFLATRLHVIDGTTTSQQTPAWLSLHIRCYPCIRNWCGHPAVSISSSSSSSSSSSAAESRLLLSDWVTSWRRFLYSTLCQCRAAIMQLGSLAAGTRTL